MLTTRSWTSGDLNYAVIASEAPVTDMVVVSVTNTVSPSTILFAEEGEVRTLLGSRTIELLSMLTARLHKKFYPLRVLALFGFKEELDFDKVREIEANLVV